MFKFLLIRLQLISPASNAVYGLKNNVRGVLNNPDIITETAAKTAMSKVMDLNNLQQMLKNAKIETKK